jgi:hypothetical protein
MTRLVESGIPVIHLSGVRVFSERYGLPYSPRDPQPVGRGGIYMRVEYNPWYAGFGIALIGVVMLAFLRLDIARSILSLGGRSSH